MSHRPLILITNDDGIHSRGLQAAVAACAPFGELLVVAPSRQQTAAGRSRPHTSTGRLEQVVFEVPGGTIVGLGVDGSPAQAVEHGIFEFATHPVDLTVSGINFGENLGENVTMSGTIAAALEAASFGVPAIAASRQTDPVHYLDHTANLDFGTAAHFLSRLVANVLAKGMPPGVDVLKLDVPECATPATPWRWTRLSRHRYSYPVAPKRPSLDHALPMGFVIRVDSATVETDSDIRALAIDGVVSLCPLSTDLTARTALADLQAWT
jgi:5'-nucleotidase